MERDVFKYPKLESYGVVVGKRSNHNVIEEIHEKLTVEQISILSNTSFGRLMSGTICQYSGCIIHCLLQLEMDVPLREGEEEMWFYVGGHHLRFGRAEFALVTGLQFGADILISEVENKENSFKERYFKGKEFVKRADLYRRFSHTDWTCFDKHDGVRMALMYLVHSLLLGARKHTYIENKMFDLVENISEFSGYNWGNVVWSRTYKSLSGSFGRYISYLEKCKRKYLYDLQGFPIAFQVWAFETIPILRKFASKVEKESGPRVLSWRLINRPSRELMEIVFNFEKDVTPITNMEPTSAEMRVESIVRSFNFFTGFQQKGVPNLIHSDTSEPSNLSPCIQCDEVETLYPCINRYNHPQGMCVPRNEADIKCGYSLCRGGADGMGERCADDVPVEISDHSDIPIELDELEICQKVVHGHGSEIDESFAEHDKRIREEHEDRFRRQCEEHDQKLHEYENRYSWYLLGCTEKMNKEIEAHKRKMDENMKAYKKEMDEKMKSYKKEMKGKCRIWKNDYDSWFQDNLRSSIKKFRTEIKDSMNGCFQNILPPVDNDLKPFSAQD